uniref:Uncharacterized protein n=1 Tax=Plectus sambesii TaxID=2011161 RepID=A0A914WPM5_9BILA
MAEDNMGAVEVAGSKVEAVVVGDNIELVEEAAAEAVEAAAAVVDNKGVAGVAAEVEVEVLGDSRLGEGNRVAPARVEDSTGAGQGGNKVEEGGGRSRAVEVVVAAAVADRSSSNETLVLFGNSSIAAEWDNRHCIALPEN